jgi:hypothetical protein
MSMAQENGYTCTHCQLQLLWLYIEEQGGLYAPRLALAHHVAPAPYLPHVRVIVQHPVLRGSQGGETGGGDGSEKLLGYKGRQCAIYFWIKEGGGEMTVSPHPTLYTQVSLPAGPALRQGPSSGRRSSTPCCATGRSADRGQAPGSVFVGGGGGAAWLIEALFHSMAGHMCKKLRNTVVA